MHLRIAAVAIVLLTSFAAAHAQTSPGDQPQANPRPPNPPASSPISPSPAGNAGEAAPVVLSAPAPAIRLSPGDARTGGSVLVALEVDQKGEPRHVHVLRGIGNGFDEKALQAVRQYRFRPALVHGKPVATSIVIDVNFSVADQPALPTATTPPR